MFCKLPTKINLNGRKNYREGFQNLMCKKIIDMKDMMSLYKITDQFGIDRELIEVPLEKDGDGAINILDNNRLQIIIPSNISIDRWLTTLENTLIQLGFCVVEEENEWTK